MDAFGTFWIFLFCFRCSFRCLFESRWLLETKDPYLTYVNLIAFATAATRAKLQYSFKFEISGSAFCFLELLHNQDAISKAFVTTVADPLLQNWKRPDDPVKSTRASHQTTATLRTRRCPGDNFGNTSQKKKPTAPCPVDRRQHESLEIPLAHPVTKYNKNDMFPNKLTVLLHFGNRNASTIWVYSRPIPSSLSLVTIFLESKLLPAEQRRSWLARQETSDRLTVSWCHLCRIYLQMVPFFSHLLRSSVKLLSFCAVSKTFALKTVDSTLSSKRSLKGITAQLKK